MTDDDLRNARERFAAGIDGWVQPVLHGMVTTATDGTKTVRVASDLAHRLPAVVLSTVIGHSAGTETLVITPEQLRRAHELLLPAEAATHTPHPNLWAWREILSGRAPALIEAVFVDNLADAVTGEADRLLRSTSPAA